MNNLPRQILQFVILVLLQVIVLNNVQVNGLINPYLYILFILLLPFETPKILLIVVSFFLGLSVDIFSNTLCMHASACVFMAYMRPFVLNYISLRDGYEIGAVPSIKSYGLSWFIKYAFILVLLHHFFLFYVEAFSFKNFFNTFSRVLMSSVFSILLIVLAQFFMSKKK